MALASTCSSLAILTFAVDVTTSGLNLNTVGVILMVAGVIGLLLSLLFWSGFSPYRRRVGTTLPDERVVEERRIERDLPDHYDGGPSEFVGTSRRAPPACRWGRAARGRRQRAAPPASHQDGLCPLTVLDRSSPMGASRFSWRPYWGVRLW
jgi:hypothetical protein